MKHFMIYYQLMINIVLFALPRLVGCRKVVSNDVGAERSFRALRNLHASLAWEFHAPCDELSNYTYRLENRLVGLIVEEWEPVKLVAPDFLINKFRLALNAGAQDIYQG